MMGNRYKKGLLVFVILLYAGILFGYQQTKQLTDLLKKKDIQTEQQNFSITYDEKLGSLYIGTYQNRVIAYDNDGNEKWCYQANGPIRELKVARENPYIYVASEDRNIYVLDVKTGDEIQVIAVQRRVYSLDLMEEKGLLAVSAGISPINHHIFLYDLEGNELMRKDMGTTVRNIMFVHNYEKIVVSTDRAEVILYDLEGNQVAQQRLRYRIADIAYSDETGQFAVLTQDNDYYLLDENLNVITTRSFAGDGRSIEGTKDFSRLLIGSESGLVHFITSEGEVLYQNQIRGPVAGFAIGEQQYYILGFEGTIYEVRRDAIDQIRIMNIAYEVLSILCYVWILVILLTMFFAVPFVHNKVISFFKKLYKHRIAYLFLIPTFILLIVFSYYPVMIAFIRSFTDWSVHKSTIEFNGLDNFRRMISEGYFMAGIRNLLVLMGTSFIKLLTIPLLVAELVFHMKRDKQKYLFRFLFILPMVVPGVVMALMWQNIYDPNIGLLNNILESIGRSDLQRVWLGDPKVAIWAIIFMGFPFMNPFAFLVYYGGLINIPSDLFEAAKVDGSNIWWNFIRIHLPLITPQIKMLLILTFIQTIQDFAPILILTGGGPGTSTYVPGLELYYNATRFGRYGYASALGLVMFLFILFGTILNLRMKTIEK